jgi:hypothetical protein
MDVCDLFIDPKLLEKLSSLDKDKYWIAVMIMDKSNKIVDVQIPRQRNTSYSSMYNLSSISLKSEEKIAGFVRLSKFSPNFISAMEETSEFPYFVAISSKTGETKSFKLS